MRRYIKTVIFLNRKNEAFRVIGVHLFIATFVVNRDTKGKARGDAPFILQMCVSTTPIFHSWTNMKLQFISAQWNGMQIFLRRINRSRIQSDNVCVSHIKHFHMCHSFGRLLHCVKLLGDSFSDFLFDFICANCFRNSLKNIYVERIKIVSTQYASMIKIASTLKIH